MIQQAEKLLLRNELQNWYMLLRLRQGYIDECAIDGASVRLHDRETQKYMYAVEDFAVFQRLYEAVRTREGLLLSLVTDDRFLPDILKQDATLAADRFYQLRAATGTEVHAVDGVSFVPMRVEHADWILSVYEHPELCREMIAERAARAPALVALHAGEPVGFIMTHCDAELGPAYVDPRMRGAGLATQLYARIMQALTERGIRPAIFTTEQNERSRRWLTRIGCETAPSRVVWFWRP
ncbi:MAG: GNAT family N-acetyltransferase [Clostridia bacterium]|nr:GNAT family N-acetyltransferase [Clostridia bacterium]